MTSPPLSTLLVDVRAQLGLDAGAQAPYPAVKPALFKPAILLTDWSLSGAYAQQASVDRSINTASDAVFITTLTTGLSDFFNPNIPAGGTTGGATTKVQDGTTATMNMNIGRGIDGSTKFGWGIQGQSANNGVSATTDVAASVDGQRCPTAEGQVSFTVKLRLGADYGGSGYTQDLTAFVRSIVDDNGVVSSTTVDLIQGTRSVRDGVSAYVETGVTWKWNADDLANATSSNLRLIRQSQNASGTDVGDFSKAGHEAAFAMARAALAISQQNWLSGGCVKIEATAPGTVQPGSVTTIPVTVLHRFDGVEVPSRLTVALAGESSVDPMSLATTPGTLAYTAPDERNKTATITLTATSRRGRATLELPANTGGQAYRAVGVSNDVSFSGEICSLEKQFVIDGSFPGGTASTRFTPGSTAGGVTEMSGGGGCTQSGAGTYAVTLNEDGAGSITWTDTATLTCPAISNTRTANFTLPLEPAPDLSCP